MKAFPAIRSAARQRLGSTFRLERRDEPADVDFELVATHLTGLQSPSIDGHDTAMADFRTKHWHLRDFVATIQGPLLLDPGLGWVVRGHDLLEIGNWSLVAQPPTLVKPSLLRWARAKMNARQVGQVVWLPYGAGNYWHFLNDMVAGLALLIERRDLAGCKVLVAETLAAKPFFKEIVGLSSQLSALDWLPYATGRWLRSTTVHVAGTSFGSHATFRRAIAMLDRLPTVETRPDRSLFITRAEASGRNPANLPEIAEALAERGFEQVQFEGLTIVEQRALVNRAGVVVALHGAGMANLAFHERPAEVKLFEITPADHLNPCFAFMAEEAGMDYYCFAGGPRDFLQNENYEVPRDDLLAALDLFLKR